MIQNVRYCSRRHFCVHSLSFILSFKSLLLFSLRTISITPFARFEGICVHCVAVFSVHTVATSLDLSQAQRKLKLRMIPRLFARV